MDSPRLPDWGGGVLASVVPSLLVGLGVPRLAAAPLPRLAPPGMRAACLLLVDGLGWEQLRAHPREAPFLTSLADGQAPITAGFPTTTASSVAALGTGLPTGLHGIVGYSFALGDGQIVDALGWRGRDGGRTVDLRERFVPEAVQPVPTAFERAAAAGMRVWLTLPATLRGSGLTRAVLRGGEFHGVHALGDLAATALAGLDGPGPALCYAYHGDLDLLGHVYGPDSLPWRLQLSQVDRLAATIAEGLPPGAALAVTADHGMVHTPPEHRVDLDTTPALQAGVRLFGGEPRARYLYTEPGATDDVAAVWTELLGDRAWIATREQAVAAGWFGPRVAAHVRDRIGDLVVAARADTAIVRTVAEPKLAPLLGQHGSLTVDEQLVPLLVHDPAGQG
jgi:hypothetical protein